MTTNSKKEEGNRDLLRIEIYEAKVNVKGRTSEEK